jgi:hypothetical protein
MSGMRLLDRGLGGRGAAQGSTATATSDTAREPDIGAARTGLPPCKRDHLATAFSDEPFFTLKGSFLLIFVMLGPTLALFSVLVVHRCFARFHWFAILAFCVFPILSALVSICQFAKAIQSF